MKRLLLSFVVWGISVIPLNVRAEVLTDPVDIIQAVRAGRSGGWLDSVALRKCLDAEVERQNLDKQISNLLQTAKTLQDQVDLYRSSDVTYKEELDKRVLQVQTLTQENVRLGASLDAWYHNPVIVGMIGVAAGALAVSAVAIAVR